MDDVTIDNQSKNNVYNYVSQEALHILPLRGMVLFPDVVTHLDVGRPKSLEGLNKAMEDGKKIFLVAQKDPLCEEPNEEDLYRVGIIAHIKQVVKLPTGIVRVLVEGERRGELKVFHNRSAFYEGFVESMSPLVADKEMETKALLRLIIHEFMDYAEINPGIKPETAMKVQNMDDPEIITNLIASQLAVDFKEKQNLLELTTFNAKAESILKSLTVEKSLIKLEQEIGEKVKGNIDKAQREYFLREQIKVIRKELNESVDYEEEIDNLRNRVKEGNYPDKVVARLEKEINRLETMSPNMAESPVLRTYIDWLLELPWFEKTEEDIDLVKVRIKLDKGHYGLEDAKERITEHLAVKKLVKDKNKSPILCLVGPPGVGKTSLASSVGEAINRKFVRMSLGGVRDEAEIRGHRRTYVGSMPGRLIQSMKTAGTKNPIILLDEIDKLGADYKGDPSSALLEALDPEQNYMFSDHYIELPYDLSDVFFITTANTLSTIPAPLRDRMEIIHLSSYTEKEKLEIAKNHLFKKQIKENGLEDYNIKIDNKSLLTIIRSYTHESGVRNLEREIGRLLRKIAVDVLEGKVTELHIKEQNVFDYLGVPKVSNYKSKRKSEVGVVNGLAVTSLGGDLLTIEGALYSGKGKLLLTGQLGDVMKESVNAAMSYLRSKNIMQDGLEELGKDIHIHVPEGAIPKDGPSAGVAMTTVLTSLFLNKKVKKDIAMTGEVTIRGHVLPIGGVKEKVLAAYANGIKTVYLPKGNEKNIEDIPIDVRNKIELILVDDVGTVIKGALEE